MYIYKQVLLYRKYLEKIEKKPLYLLQKNLDEKEIPKVGDCPTSLEYGWNAVLQQKEPVSNKFEVILIEGIKEEMKKEKERKVKVGLNPFSSTTGNGFSLTWQKSNSFNFKLSL